MGKRAAREILKQRGLTDEDIAGMETLLSNPKFVAALEAEAEAADTAAAEQARLTGLLDEDVKWYNNTVVPTTEKLTRDAIDANARAAAAEARLKQMQEYGLAKVGEKQDAGDTRPDLSPAGPANPPAGAAPMNFDEEFNKRAAPFANVAMDSQVMLQDISDDHRDLFGSRLPGGMSGLRAEWNDAVQSRRYKGSMKQFWEEKYKVADKRQEVQAKAEEEKYQARLKEEKAKWVSENANPNTRPFASSRNPFTNRPAAASGDGQGSPGGTGSGGRASQPWDNPDRGKDRVQRTASKFALQ